MLTLERGANTKIPHGLIEVLIEWTPEQLGGCDVDASAFLLLASGKVASDEAFIFYGNLSSPECSVRLQPDRGASRFQVDLERVPASIDKIAFALTIHGRRSFASASMLRFTVPGVACFSPPTTGMSEAAIILGEIYRRDEGWKCRAVGQGWNGGLAPLATHFGVDVSSDDAVHSAPSPSRQATASPPPPSAHPSPSQGAGSSLANTARNLLGLGRHEPSTPESTPVSQRGSICLEKRQTVSLEKTAGRPLRKVLFGLGWDAAEAGDSIDLDASVVLLDAARNVLDVVFFGHLHSSDGSVEHTGDNLTGDGEGDDEQIRVDLGSLPRNTATLVFTINSYRGHKFSEVRNAFCRVVDESNGKELARYNLSRGPRCTAMLMANVQRRGDDWHMTALGEPAEGRTVRDILDNVRQHA